MVHGLWWNHSNSLHQLKILLIVRFLVGLVEDPLLLLDRDLHGLLVFIFRVPPRCFLSRALSLGHRGGEINRISCHWSRGFGVWSYNELTLASHAGGLGFRRHKAPNPCKARCWPIPLPPSPPPLPDPSGPSLRRRGGGNSKAVTALALECQRSRSFATLRSAPGP